MTEADEYEKFWGRPRPTPKIVEQKCGCGNNTFKILYPEGAVAVDQIESTICAKCGKEQ